jgi:hypothetical protein
MDISRDAQTFLLLLGEKAGMREDNKPICPPDARNGTHDQAAGWNGSLGWTSRTAAPNKISLSCWPVLSLAQKQGILFCSNSTTEMAT